MRILAGPNPANYVNAFHGRVQKRNTTTRTGITINVPADIGPNLFFKARYDTHTV